MPRQTGLTGKGRVEEAEVLAVPEPAATRTWSPVSHARLVAAVEMACKEHGVEVATREYSMTPGGARMFGAWALGAPGRDSGPCVGFRNSLNKELAIGLTAGTRVMVCSNLAFSGEFVEFRRHVGPLGDDALAQMASRALAACLQRADEAFERLEAMKEVGLERRSTRAMALTMEAFHIGAIPLRGVEKMWGLFHAPEAPQDGTDLAYPETLWGWHGAATETIRDRSLVWSVGAGGQHKALEALVRGVFEALGPRTFPAHPNCRCDLGDGVLLGPAGEPLGRLEAVTMEADGQITAAARRAGLLPPRTEP